MSRIRTLVSLILFCLSGHTWADFAVVPPMVTFIAPIDGRYIAPAAPMFYVSAHPSYGDPIIQPPTSVSRVDFLDGETVIGTLTSPNSQTTTGAPAYAFIWTNPPTGIHLINARVTDTAGLSAIQINHGTGMPTPIKVVIVEANPPPRVSLVSPTTGQIFTTSGSVSLASVAASPRAAIRRVEFVVGNTVVASTYSPPYSAQWSNPPSGDFAVVAKAYDDHGAVAVSPASYIRVFASRDPSVVMTAPSSGAVYESDTALKMSAVALAPDGNIGRVEFYAGSNLVGSAATSPYDFYWTSPQSGALSLTAKAYDVLGASAVSAPVAVVVSGSLIPTVALIAPAAGATFAAPATIALSAIASESGGSIGKVEFFSNGNVVGSVTVPPYNFSWTGVAAGTYVLMAKGTDNRGATALSTAIAITVESNQPPVIEMTLPPKGQSFSVGEPISLAADASDPDGAVAKVEFLVDAAVVGTATSRPYTNVWNGSVGTHALAARATDNQGATTTSAIVDITVAGISSTSVSLSMPRNGNVFAVGAPISVGAIATTGSGAIARVEFYVDGVMLASATSAPYGVTWSNATAGTHTLMAKAVDERGAVTTSTSVSVEVITPTLTIVTPVANTSLAADFVLVTGTYRGPPNSGVTVNGVVARNDGQGNYFVNNLPLADGSDTLTAILTTPDGQSTTQTQTVMRTGVSRMQIYAEPDIDFAPATFTIRVTNRTNNTIANVTFQNLGGGQFDASMLDQTTLGRISYALPGVYQPEFVVTDSLGNTYIQPVMILAQDKVTLDRMLKVVWGQFTGALASGNKGDAIVNLSGPAANKYGPVLDTLSNDLESIVSSWSPPATGTLSDGIAEYAIQRNIADTKRFFLVYLLRGVDGVWRIDSM